MPQQQQSMEPQSEQDLQNATFTVRNPATGETREVTQQQFMDEHLDSEGWRNVSPLQAAEAQRRTQARQAAGASTEPAGTATGSEQDVEDDDTDVGPPAEGETDFDAMTVEELRARAAELDISVKRGRGEEGPPLREDYVRTLRRAERKAAKQAQG